MIWFVLWGLTGVLLAVGWWAHRRREHRRQVRYLGLKRCTDNNCEICRSWENNR